MFGDQIQDRSKPSSLYGAQRRPRLRLQPQAADSDRRVGWPPMSHAQNQQAINFSMARSHRYRLHPEHYQLRITPTNLIARPIHITNVSSSPSSSSLPLPISGPACVSSRPGVPDGCSSHARHMHNLARRVVHKSVHKSDHRMELPHAQYSSSLSAKPTDQQ